MKRFDQGEWDALFRRLKEKLDAALGPFPRTGTGGGT
jgi:hypothetical protein